MPLQSDRAAYCIANTYGFLPPHSAGPKRKRQTDSGKYEPDSRAGQADRTFVFAHWSGKSNILVKFVEDDLPI